MKKIYIIAVTSLLFISNSKLTAQDMRGSQSIYGTILNVNPALMGLNTDLKLILNYRSQWKSIQDGYSRYSFNGLYPLYLKDGSQKLDIGLSVDNNKQGAFSNLEAGLSVGYNIQLGKSSFMSLALQGSYYQNSLDASGLTFDDQYVLGQYSALNPTSQPITSQSVNFVNVGFGLMWYYVPTEESNINTFLGVSGYNLSEPNATYNIAQDPLYKRFSFQGGFKVIGENKIDVTPNIISNFQNGSSELLAGVKFDYRLSETNKVYFGAWYRKKDAYPLLLGLTISNLSLNYSYDVTSSMLSSNISGLATHEITLSYKVGLSNSKGKVLPSL